MPNFFYCLWPWNFILVLISCKTFCFLPLKKSIYEYKSHNKSESCRNPSNSSRVRSWESVACCSHPDNSVETQRGGWLGEGEGNADEICCLPVTSMCLVTLLLMLVWLLKARQVYSPLCSWLTADSSSSGPAASTRTPLTAHHSWAAGLDCAEQSKVRLDPAWKEVEFWLFTVRSMLSGPSGNEVRVVRVQRSVCSGISPQHASLTHMINYADQNISRECHNCIAVVFSL